MLRGLAENVEMQKSREPEVSFSIKLTTQIMLLISQSASPEQFLYFDAPPVAIRKPCYIAYRPWTESRTAVDQTPDPRLNSGPKFSNFRAPPIQWQAGRNVRLKALINLIEWRTTTSTTTNDQTDNNCQRFHPFPLPPAPPSQPTPRPLPSPIRPGLVFV